jgi:hypothetical protein
MLRLFKVYAIGFLMAKTRINGPTRSQVGDLVNEIVDFHVELIVSQALYNLATLKYLPYVVANPDPIIRAQGLLLLTVYALHIPSRENIATLSSWTTRFCVLAQLHLAETEPPPVNSDALIHIQHRRRIFWCAYAIDRAVCSSYDLPFSVPDNHITVAVGISCISLISLLTTS